MSEFVDWRFGMMPKTWLRVRVPDPSRPDVRGW